MQQKKVEEIIMPYKEGTPLHPYVTTDDKIVRAIELMLNHNLKSIAVVRKGRFIGRVCLHIALQKLGLQVEKMDSNPIQYSRS